MSGTLHRRRDSTFAVNTGAYYASQIYNLVYDGHTARTAQTTLRDTIVADGVGAADVASNKTTYITPANLGSANADVSQFDLVRTTSAQEEGTVTRLAADRRPDARSAARTTAGRPRRWRSCPAARRSTRATPVASTSPGRRSRSDQRGVLRPAGTGV